MKKILFNVIVISSIMCIVGCASRQQKQTEPLCMENTLTEQAMLAAQGILERMHFNLEKFDPEAGYIRTRPLSGAQFFEFWKQDNASAYASAQSNLHSIQRVAELEFTHENTTVCVRCRVSAMRLSIPEKPIEGNQGMAGLFTNSTSQDQSLRANPGNLAEVEWIDAGQDQALEERILKLIDKEVR